MLVLCHTKTEKLLRPDFDTLLGFDTLRYSTQASIQAAALRDWSVGECSRTR